MTARRLALLAAGCGRRVFQELVLFDANRKEASIFLRMKLSTSIFLVSVLLGLLINDGECWRRRRRKQLPSKGENAVKQQIFLNQSKLNPFA